MPSKKTASKIHVGSIVLQGEAKMRDLNITVKEATAKKAAKEKYADGTIGRNALKKNYITYLQARYYEFKKADRSFGVDPVEHARVMAGLYRVLNNTIAKKLGALPFQMPEESFPVLVAYLEDKINGTRQGRVNSKAKEANYHSFEAHCDLGKPKT